MRTKAKYEIGKEPFEGYYFGVSIMHESMLNNGVYNTVFSKYYKTENEAKIAAHTFCKDIGLVIDE